VIGRDKSLPSANWSKIVYTLVDLDARFRIMDAFDEYIQVISISSPPNYSIAKPPLSFELARVDNDELAGIDQLVFGTDLPFGNQLGRRLIRETIRAMERMGLTDEEKLKIYRDNAVKLMKLPLGAT